MVSNIKKVSAIIVATFMLLAMSAFFNSNVHAATLYTKTLSNGVTVTADKALDQEAITNPGGANTQVAIHVTITPGTANILTVKLVNKYHPEGDREYSLAAEGGSIDIKTAIAGHYYLKIMTTELKEDSVEFYIRPKTPSNIKFTTSPDNVFVNTMSAPKGSYGQNTWIGIVETDEHVIMENFQNGYAFTGTSLQPGKKYTFNLYGYDEVEPDGYLGSKDFAKKTIVMGPSTTPVIKSIKISNVKSKKYFDTGYWEYRYNNSWKVTVTLKKKAKGNLGLEIHDGIDGYYTKAGKNKSKYTFTMKRNSPYSYKGQTINFAVRTYSNKDCKAYSNWSAIKKVKIK